MDRREPCSQDWQYNPGTSAEPKWSRENKDWPVSSRFYTSGTPPAETMRARGVNRISQVEPNLYARSNYMTSTYRKPVYSIFGPLQREKVYGLTHQHNRHGFMPFEDYYWLLELEGQGLIWVGGGTQVSGKNRSDLWTGSKLWGRFFQVDFVKSLLLLLCLIDLTFFIQGLLTIVKDCN